MTHPLGDAYDALTPIWSGVHAKLTADDTLVALLRRAESEGFSRVFLGDVPSYEPGTEGDPAPRPLTAPYIRRTPLTEDAANTFGRRGAITPERLSIFARSHGEAARIWARVKMVLDETAIALPDDAACAFVRGTVRLVDTLPDPVGVQYVVDYVTRTRAL